MCAPGCGFGKPKEKPPSCHVPQQFYRKKCSIFQAVCDKGGRILSDASTPQEWKMLLLRRRRKNDKLYLVYFYVPKI